MQVRISCGFFKLKQQKLEHTVNYYITMLQIKQLKLPPVWLCPADC